VTFCIHGGAVLEILWVSSQIPYPPSKNGGAHATFHLLRELKNFGCLIDFISLSGGPTDEIPHELQEIIRNFSAVSYLRRNSLGRSIMNLLRLKPQALVYQPFFNTRAHRVSSAYDVCIFDNLVCSRFPIDFSGRKVLFAVDSFSKLYESELPNVQGLRRIYKTAQVVLMKRLERRTFSEFDKVVLVSTEDETYCRRNLGLNNLATIGLGVEGSSRQSPDQVRVLFVGNFEYRPNLDAVFYFTEKVLPSLLERHPNTIFLVAGRNLPSDITRLANHPSIQILGYVDEIADAYAVADIFVSPLVSGAGVKNKVLEAMYYGVPSVISTISAEGIHRLQDGVNCYIARDEREWQSKLTALMDSNEIRRKIGESGKRLVERHYSWANVGRSFEAAVLSRDSTST